MAKYVDIEPYFDNTTMQAYYNDNDVLRTFEITACEGYVLHASTLDEQIVDEETLEPTGEIKLGYTKATISVLYNYNFETNPFEIYAEPSCPALEEF